MRKLLAASILAFALASYSPIASADDPPGCDNPIVCVEDCTIPEGVNELGWVEKCIPLLSDG